MTMVHLSDHLYGGYNGRKSFSNGNTLINGGQVCEYSSITTVTEYCNLGSDLLLPPHMAEDESRTNTLNEEEEEEEDASTRDESWLQLSIGSGNNKNEQRSSGLVELDLLPAGDSSKHDSNIRIPASSSYNLVAGASPELLQGSGISGSSNFLQQEINWGFRGNPQCNYVAGVGSVPAGSLSTLAASSPSSSSSFLPLMGRFSSYFGRPLIQFQSSLGADLAGPSSELTVISPPHRPHSGFWFTLKALENQAKEPFLPQISKNYLRIKDGKMTVRLVMKYLVSKLSLESESEIEIRCRGQHLHPFLTLKHVRDSIWNSSSSTSSSSSRDSLFNLLPHSSTTHHLMILHYGRIN